MTPILPFNIIKSGEVQICAKGFKISPSRTEGFAPNVEDSAYKQTSPKVR